MKGFYLIWVLRIFSPCRYRPHLASISWMAHRLRQVVPWSWHEYVELFYTRMRCNFFLKQVTVLSHAVTSKIHNVDPSLTKRINKFLHERLRYIRGIRKLLWRVGYLRRHIPNFSTITRTVYDLLKKKKKKNGIRNETFIMQNSHKLLKKHNEYLETLVPAVASSPILEYLEFEFDWPSYAWLGKTPSRPHPNSHVLVYFAL